jgi:nitric oxide reductase NorQ protein
MFENETQELQNALSDREAPLPRDKAIEIAGGGIKGESVLSQEATVEEREGEKMVVSVGGVAYDDNAQNGAHNGSKSVAEEEDADDLQDDESAQNGADDRLSNVSHDDSLMVHNVNGLRITTDPSDELVGEPTGSFWFGGLRVLEDSRDDVPSPNIEYRPVEMASRTSDEFFARALGRLVRPVLIEGEAGTGKNTLIKHVANQTNRPTTRINFGSDISVFDLVGEKDIVDGESVYVLGGLAKAAMFGHIVVLDEVNMATGGTTSFIHAVTEEIGDRQLELRGTDVTLRDLPVTDEEVEEARESLQSEVDGPINEERAVYEAQLAKWNPNEHLGRYIHPEFRVTATCNPLDYADTNSMNDAFRDRFVTFSHPYLSEEGERSMLADATGADEGEIRSLVRVAHVLREARAEANKLSCPITPRTLIKTIEMAGPDQGFMSFKDAAKVVMVDHASIKKDKQFIHDTIADEM